MKCISPNYNKDIYIEINNRKIAIIQSYSIKSIREYKSIESFGSKEPIAILPKYLKHFIDISKIQLLNTEFSDNIDFFSLSNFNLTIFRPDKQLIFSGCEWISISESFSINKNCIESISISSIQRLEI